MSVLQTPDSAAAGSDAAVEQDASAGAAAAVRRSPPTSSVVVPLVAAVLLLTVAAVVGALLTRSGSRLYVDAPPLIARLIPHVGPGTPAAILLALLGVVLARRWLGRLRWSRLLPLSYLGALAWTFSLSLIDTGERGWAAPLGEKDEYLHDLPRVSDVHGFLSSFSDHILDFQPGSWTTHVSSHPPLATLFFWALDRIGLGGQTWAGIAVIVLGSTVAVSVPITLRALGAAGAARAMVPFGIFFPGAVWVGTSADGMFAGVLAAGIAAAAWGSTRRSARTAVPWSSIGGVLLGATLYLSYGLAVAIVLVAAVCWCSWRSVRTRGGSVRLWSSAWAMVVVGVAAVAIWFFTNGFHWFSALSLLQTRYYQGIASARPYSYFVWANLAALVVCAGPAFATSVTTAARAAWAGVRHGRRTEGAARRRIGVPALLTAATAIAVLLADLSGLSKAETERIWLPFGVWLLCGVVVLSQRWRWRLLVLQIGTALLVNHLLLTHW
ncbi:MAG: hypothetical protein WKF57_20390 [Nakamurella sp.]